LKSSSVILLLHFLLLLFACGGNSEADRLLSAADSLSCVNPDSALRLLTSAPFASADRPSGSAAAPAGKALTTSQRMRLELLRARCMNKTFIPVGVDMRTPSDSMLLLVAGYYDRHGSPNEQMEAHYLLGCAYRDMGEAPRAVDCYLDAIAKADTTAADCDFITISCIYSQIAYLYHTQLLLTYEIEAHNKAIHYNYIVGDTLGAIYEKKMIAGAYILANQNDLAEQILDEVVQQYSESGQEQAAIQSSTMLMHLYINNPQRQNKLKRLIDIYEENCCLFDGNNELPPSKRLFYYYKGKYFENAGLLDTAENCYRKLHRAKISFVSSDPMYSGLLSVFQRKHQADSIAKYAELYCAVNDSSISIKDRELTARLAASYNYSRYQKEALDNAKTANQRLYMVVIMLSISLIVFIVAAFLWRLYKNKQKTLEQIEREYAEARKNYDRTTLQMKEMDTKHKKIIEAVKKENAESHNIIAMLNTQHETEREQLAQTLQSYKEKAELLERQLKITQYRKVSAPFLSLGIVKRIKLYAEDSHQVLNDNDLHTLTDAVKDHFPDLIADLNSAPSITPLAKNVCLLTLLNLKPGEIVALLGISSSQVSNLRKDINAALFNENTTRTLYQNLTKRYKILYS